MILLLILQNVQLDKPESNDDFLPRKLFMFGIDTIYCQPKVSIQKYVLEQSNTKNLAILLDTFSCKCSKLRITVLHALLPSLTFGKRHNIIKLKLAYIFFFIYSLQHAIQPRIYMRKLIIIEKKKRTNKVFVQKSRRYGKKPVK